MSLLHELHRFQRPLWRDKRRARVQPRSWSASIFECHASMFYYSRDAASLTGCTSCYRPFHGLADTASSLWQVGTIVQWPQHGMAIGSSMYMPLTLPQRDNGLSLCGSSWLLTYCGSLLAADGLQIYTTTSPVLGGLDRLGEASSSAGRKGGHRFRL